MILTAHQVRALMARPGFLAGRVISDDERSSLNELGVRPFIDQLIDAYVDGVGVDTSVSDMMSEAAKVMIVAERARLLGGDAA